eukprot:NODE_395_length_2302_cov_26.864368_g366_i0.p1 GENE.NODE_395_length_2302_cov_26.864368_g366_i0~~NODE_395_length_2302_cov_26.864368_g366_i0.p1  ORF type:complete len:735 (-),score=188.12 NODE_395_length_2302_cov_26.864368_g366_i0:15-2219(-)
MPQSRQPRGALMQLPSEYYNAVLYDTLAPIEIEELLLTYLQASNAYIIQHLRKIYKHVSPDQFRQIYPQLKTFWKHWKREAMETEQRLKIEVTEKFSDEKAKPGEFDQKTIFRLQEEAEKRMKSACQRMDAFITDDPLLQSIESLQPTKSEKYAKEKRYEWCSESSRRWLPICAELTCPEFVPAPEPSTLSRLNLLIPLNQWFDEESGNFDHHGSFGSSSSDRHRETSRACNAWYTEYGVEGKPPLISGFRTGAMSQYAMPTQNLNVSHTMVEHTLQAIVLQELRQLSLEEQHKYLCRPNEFLSDKETLVIDVTNVSLLSPTILDTPAKMKKRSTEDIILQLHKTAMMAFDCDVGKDLCQKRFLPFHLKWKFSDHTGAASSDPSLAQQLPSNLSTRIPLSAMSEVFDEIPNRIRSGAMIIQCPNIPHLDLPQSSNSGQSQPSPQVSPRGPCHPSMLSANKWLPKWLKFPLEEDSDDEDSTFPPLLSVLEDSDIPTTPNSPDVMECRIKVKFRINLFNFIIDDVASSAFKCMLAFTPEYRKHWDDFCKRYQLSAKQCSNDGKEAQAGGTRRKRNSGTLSDEFVENNIEVLVQDIAKLHDFYDEGIGALIRRGVHPAACAVRILMLAWMMGHSIVWNCKSGKDRTGVVDIELKLLAELNQQLGAIPSLEQCDAYRDRLIRFRRELFLGAGNMDVQKVNTGIAGFKMQRLQNNLNPSLLGGEDIFKMALHGSMFATS